MEKVYQTVLPFNSLRYEKQILLHPAVFKTEVGVISISPLVLICSQLIISFILYFIDIVQRNIACIKIDNEMREIYYIYTL